MVKNHAYLNSWGKLLKANGNKCALLQLHFDIFLVALLNILELHHLVITL